MEWNTRRHRCSSTTAIARSAARAPAGSSPIGTGRTGRRLAAPQCRRARAPRLRPPLTCARPWVERSRARPVTRPPSPSLTRSEPRTVGLGRRRSPARPSVSVACRRRLSADRRWRDRLPGGDARLSNVRPKGDRIATERRAGWHRVERELRRLVVGGGAAGCVVAARLASRRLGLSCCSKPAPIVAPTCRLSCERLGHRTQLVRLGLQSEPGADGDVKPSGGRSSWAGRPG